MMTTLTLHQLFEKMLAAIGPQGWLPANTKPEIIVGAILVQTTNWNNVKKYLANIKRSTGFQPDQIVKPDMINLIKFIRPSGFRCLSI